MGDRHRLTWILSLMLLTAGCGSAHPRHCVSERDCRNPSNDGLRVVVPADRGAVYSPPPPQPAAVSPAPPPPEPLTPPGPAPVARPVPPNAKLRCDGSAHDAELLARILIDEVLALRSTLPPLADLTREKSVYLPPHSRHWHGSIQHSRGSFRDDTSHCQPGRLCGVRRIYEPSSFAVALLFHSDPAVELMSQHSSPTKPIGPLFIKLQVSGAPDVDTKHIRGALNGSIQTVRQRHQKRCGPGP